MTSDVPAWPFEMTLPDPGLVLNSADAEHCVHACFQMLYRTRGGYAVPSFADLDDSFGKVPGKYTYEFNLLVDMADTGFEVEVVWALNMESLRDDPAAEFVRHFGEEVGGEYIANTDLTLLSSHARRMAKSQVVRHVRPATQADVFRYLSEGFYLMATINQRVLQADPGYVAHSIFVYGASKRGIRFHNPGPPATASSEITWDLFEQAWCDGGPQVANLLAFRPEPGDGNSR